MAVYTSEPIIWEDGDFRFTLDRSTLTPVITFITDVSDDMRAIACQTAGALASGPRLVPLNDAGFEWLACEIRLAWSETRVAELETRLSAHECVNHPEPQLGVCDDCDSHNPEPMEQLGPWST